MKARGWYKGKGSHKEAVPARITNVVRGPWGARIVIASSESGSRDSFDITLEPAEADDLAQKLTSTRPDGGK